MGSCDDVEYESRDFEVKLEGFGVWNPDTDIDIIYTPVSRNNVMELCLCYLFTQGHTAGSMCVLYRSPVEPVLFTGDHLSFSGKTKKLTGWKGKNMYSIKEQSEYIRELAKDKYKFLWILPGQLFIVGEECSDIEAYV